MSGLEFSSAWERRFEIEIDGKPIPVLGLEDLVANKIAAGRDKDLVDVGLLRKGIGG